MNQAGSFILVGRYDSDGSKRFMSHPSPYCQTTRATRVPSLNTVNLHAHHVILICVSASANLNYLTTARNLTRTSCCYRLTLVPRSLKMILWLLVFIVHLPLLPVWLHHSLSRCTDLVLTYSKEFSYEIRMDADRGGPCKGTNAARWPDTMLTWEPPSLHCVLTATLHNNLMDREQRR
jgi:hypothetical protein